MDLFVLIAENTQIELKKLDETISILIDMAHRITINETIILYLPCNK